MYIIKIDAYENGSRPPLQTWSGKNAPKGYAFCPDEFFEKFYSTDPAGFVDIEIEGGIVVSMVVNEVALETYIASLPEVKPMVDPEPSTDDVLNALLGVSE